MGSPVQVPDRLPADFDFSKPINISVPDRLPADFDFSTPKASGAADHAVRDQLMHEGFLDSAWNSIKAPFSAMGSLLNGEYRRQHEADFQRFEELQKNGTPEERREFGKEMVLKHFPLASTIYKAAQGNVAGAAGDVAGMVPLAVAGAATTPEVAGAVRRGAGAFSDAVSEAPISKTGAAIGGAAGTAAGYKAGGPVGAAAGGVAGAAIGGKLGALRAAFARAIQSLKTGYQMETNPPRPEPAWKALPDPQTAPTPNFEPIRATALPSGRIPGVKQPGKFGTAAEAAPPEGGVPGHPHARFVEPGEPETSPIDPLGAPPRTPNPNGVTTVPSGSAPRQAAMAAAKETEARAAKVQTLAQTLHDHGIGAADALQMGMGQWQDVAKAVGVNEPSATTIGQIISELHRLEMASQAPAVAKNPRALAAAEALRDEMTRSGTLSAGN